jgi:hypothetical protein
MPAREERGPDPPRRHQAARVLGLCPDAALPRAFIGRHGADAQRAGDAAVARPAQPARLDAWRGHGAVRVPATAGLLPGLAGRAASTLPVRYDRRVTAVLPPRAGCWCGHGETREQGRRMRPAEVQGTLPRLCPQRGERGETGLLQVLAQCAAHGPSRSRASPSSRTATAMRREIATVKVPRVLPRLIPMPASGEEEVQSWT